MKKGMKLLATILTIACVVIPFAGCKSNGGSAPKKQKQIVLTVMEQQDAWFQGVVREWQSLAKANNFKLTLMDPNMDNSKEQKIIEDIIALHPDGVAFAPLDSQISENQVKQVMAAGIKVVPYNIAPATIICPTVIGDNLEGGVIAGENAGKLWKQDHPNDAPVIGLVSQVGMQVITDRVNGFMQGFQEVYPNSKAVETVDGKGAEATALTVTEDMLQAHPDINVIFGDNDPSGLGALSALKEVKRNTIDKALVCAIDGSQASLLQVIDPNSALKVDVGNPPKEMADTTWDTLSKMINGTLSSTSTTQIKVPFVFIPSSNVSNWLKTEYNQTV